eukprot:8577251-Alexandrium_andersonii.AAC.1
MAGGRYTVTEHSNWGSSRRLSRRPLRGGRRTHGQHDEARSRVPDSHIHTSAPRAPAQCNGDTVQNSQAQCSRQRFNGKK